MKKTGKPKRRWFHLTPGRLLLGLLTVEGFLLLFQWFRWFPKGWAVLAAVAAVGAAMLLMILWFVFSLLLRCRFQLSIRSLLMLTVSVAIPCGWLAAEMKKAKEQGDAVAEITETAGMMVRYDYQVNGPANIFGAVPREPDWLLTLLGGHFFWDVVVLVSLHDSVRHPSSRRISFGNAALEHVKKLGRLRCIWLGYTQVTDAGLVHLKGLHELDDLILSNTRITDAGLKHLEGLTQLRLLGLENTQVTDDGVKKLQRALPNCTIYR